MHDQRTRLTGLCRLEFEGQEFKPAAPSEDGRISCEYWLTVSAAAKTQLALAFGLEESQLQWAGWFEAEFWGELSELAGNAGHLGMYRGDAFMNELISARLLSPFPHFGSKMGPHLGIRGRLMLMAARRNTEGGA